MRRAHGTQVPIVDGILHGWTAAKHEHAAPRAVSNCTGDACGVQLASGASAPEHAGEVPVTAVDALWFEASIEAARRVIEIDGERFVVASPGHIPGTRLATLELPADAQWACFILMRTCEGHLDLEEVRGFLKRCGSIGRQALLAELAYLAA